MNINNMRYNYLDLLRSLCVIYIVSFWHMLDYVDFDIHYKNFLTYRFTWIILGVFVFLSGYFIGSKQFKFEIKYIKKFYINRFIRIYPLYLLSLIVFYFFGILDLFTMVKGFFILSMFWKPAPPTLWFISMILIYYLISPLIIREIYNKRYNIVWISYILLSIFFICMNYLFNNLDFRIIAYFPVFFLGMLYSVDKYIFQNKVFIIFCLLFGFVISFMFRDLDIQYQILFSTLMISICAYCIFYIFDIYQDKLFVNNVVVYRMSVSSYCVYLFHRPMYTFMKSWYFPEILIMQLCYILIFCLPLIIFISYYIQIFYNNISIIILSRASDT